MPTPHPPRLYHSSLTANAILGVGLKKIPGASMTFAIVVHRRALVALAAATAVDARSVSSNHYRTVMGSVGKLEVPYWRRCSEPIGQRWALLVHDELVIRDFNPHSI
jgi:hypothetical protein